MDSFAGFNQFFYGFWQKYHNFAKKNLQRPLNLTNAVKWAQM